MRQLDELKDVKQAPARYVDAAGDTMTGNLNFSINASNPISIDFSGVGGGWARGLVFKANNTTYAGMGMLGHQGAVDQFYLGFGSDDTFYSPNNGLAIYQNAIKFKGTDISLNGHTHPYIPLSGGTCTGLIQFASGYSSKGIRFNDTGITINSTTGEDLVILKATGGIRFSDLEEWNYNSWAGIKYIHSEKKLYIGGPHGSKITSNGDTPLIDVDMSAGTAGVGTLYTNNITSYGKIVTPNANMGIRLGDDVEIGDSNVSNHMVIQGCQDQSLAGITFGSGKDTNIYRGGANRLQTDDTFNAIGGLQWNGQSLDERYFARRWEVGTSTDWNSLIQPGCYKVQMAAWGDASTNAPRVGYSYGLLMVYRTSVTSEDRLFQLYIPHRSDEARMFRMCNAGTWHNWEYQDVRPSADDRYFARSATRLNGVDLNTLTKGGFYAIAHHEKACSNLPIASDGYLQVIPWNSGQWCAQLFINDIEGDTYIRTNNVTGGGVQWTSWGKIYDSNHKPTPSEIGAVATSSVTPNITANTIVQRDNAGDVNTRLLRTNYQNENYMNGAIAFRTNNSSDNYTRYCSNPAAVRGWLEFGNWRFSTQDILVHDKRAMVGMNNSSGNKLYINYQNDFGNGTMVNGRLNIGDSSKFMDLGISNNDVAIGNSKNSAWLQLKDDGRLCYNNTRVQLEPQQTPLWQGASYLNQDQNFTPSKPIKQCQNGWILVFCDYDVGEGEKNWNYSIHYIPKNSIVINSGNTLFAVPNNETGGITIKAAYITDTQIKGCSDDKQDGWNDVVLRQVLEY